jgi:hypothetical protein
MKKIFTILGLTVLSGGLFAQNIQILDPENSSANVSNTVLDIYESFPNYTVKELDVKNNTGSTKSVKLKRTLVSMNLSTPNQDTVEMCWNVCLQPSWNTVQSAGNVSIAANDTASFSSNGIGFHSTFRPANISGVRTIRYTFWDISNTTDSVNVIINYHYTATGINENLKLFSFSNPQPNPAGSYTTIRYDFPFAAKAKLKVYNAVGSLVKEMRLEDENGKVTINTEELPNGIYFYSLIVNDKIAGTKKLIVAN